jgi:hypothetical protein
MKRILIVIAMLLVTSAAFAQQESPASPFKTRVFELHNREPGDVASAIRLLQSGAKGAEIALSHELRTITVRDYPENLVAIEDAIKRLDVARPASAEATLKMWIAIASKTPLANTGAIPEEIEPVIRELKTTLRYSHYALLAASVSRVGSGMNLEGSGIAEATVLGIGHDGVQPPVYVYNLLHPVIATGDRRTLSTDRFKFGVKVPIDTGKGISYQDVGFETPVTIRDREKVVIGTTTLGDKALIVVVTAEIAQ